MKWFYAEGEVQKGPVTEEEFQSLVNAGTITDSTLVWHEGMAGWQPYGARRAAAAASAATSTPASAGSDASEAVEAAESVRLQFTGRAGEYFKIWIVNLLLTIVTLGIYAAWAKVRTKRYFYANTRLFGHAFEYLANPVKILIGNIIVVALFIAINVAHTISIFAWLVLVVLLVFAVPWFVVRAFTFNARNSAWRGLKFRFEGRYGQAFCIFVLLQLVIPLSLGLAYPWVARVRREWVVTQHAYGRTNFAFAGSVGGFYRIYLAALGFFLPLILLYGIMIAGAAVTQRTGQASPIFALFGLLIFPALLLAYAGVFYLRVRLFNFSWNHTRIGSHSFRAHMEFWPYFCIRFSNGIVTALTLGLMYPWARVRLAEYTAGSLEVIRGGSLDEFVAAAQPETSAIGEAASDLFDLDVGIDFGL